MYIKPLPRDVVAQIKSSVTITSLNDVVFGLLQNSLDAAATKVNISVDYSRGNCSAEDNGEGISPSDFRDDGGLGKPYYTSRHPPCPDFHGRHGTFLASVGGVSLLSITSHHQDYWSHNSLVIHNAKVATRNLPASPERRVLSFPTSGTRVTVRDLFGAMPVRVKQRAMDGERQSHPFARDFEQLVFRLASLLLVWPRPISLSLRNAANNKIVSLRTPEIGAQQIRKTTSRKRRRTDPVPDLISRIMRILAQAGLSDDDTGSGASWVSIGASASSSGISIRGCVSLKPVATKRLQFIALGIRPLLNEHASNFLYDELNRVFANSSFGAIEEANEASNDGQGSSSSEKPASKPIKMDGFTAKELKPGRKGIDRWPKFFVQIIFDGAARERMVNPDEEALDDRHHVAMAISDLLRVMAYEFLKKHHLRPRAVDAMRGMRIRGGRSCESPRANTPPENQSASISSQVGVLKTGARASSLCRDRAQSPFAAWSRIKTGRPKVDIRKIARDVRPSSSMAGQSTSNDHSKGKVDDRPLVPPTIPNTSPDKKPTSESQDKNDELRETAVWVDPATNTRSVVDTRTGFVIHSTTNAAKRLSLPVPDFLKEAAFSSGVNVDEGDPKQAFPDSSRVASSSAPLQLRDMIAKWNEENPVFPKVEAPIPRLSGVSDYFASSRQDGCQGHGVGSQSFGITTRGLQGRISRQALRRAEIVGQVDRKFILAKVPLAQGHYVAQSSSPPGDGLINDATHLMILIDQHAADERCRVETLMRDYFTGNPETDGQSWSKSSSQHKTKTGAQMKAHTASLDRPLRFDLPARDGELLVRFRRDFEHWGTIYEVFEKGDPVQKGLQGRMIISQLNSGGDARQKAATVEVEVRKLPPAILERCRLEPRLLAELLRAEVWRLHDEPGLQNPAGDGYWPKETEKVEVDGGEGRAGEPGQEQHAWVPLFHRCPKGILDMINSRACRSAIMFNDPLSTEQCTDLVRRLTTCAFPFQCAHGRPSMVPLVDLGPFTEGTAAFGGNAAWERTAAMKEGSMMADLRLWKDGMRKTRDSLDLRGKNASRIPT